MSKEGSLGFATLILLSGCFGPPAPTPELPISQTSTPKLEHTISTIGSGLWLIPILVAEETRLRAPWNLTSRGQDAWTIMHLALNGNQIQLSQIYQQQEGPRYSKSKHINDQTNVYTEECLDGRTRKSRSDAPCSLVWLVKDREDSLARGFSHTIQPGWGYLLLAQSPMNLTLNLTFTKPVTLGTPMQRTSTTHMMSLENFDAKYMDITACQGDRLCGTVYEGTYQIPVVLGKLTFVKTIAFTGQPGYMKFCQRTNNASNTFCGDGDVDAFGYGSYYYQVLPASTTSARFEVTANSNDGRAIVPGMKMKGLFASFDLPETFPLTTG